MDFKSTSELAVPKQIVGQIIGQDSAVDIIKKASAQRRHVLLIGVPGCGKSMLGQALAELLPQSKLTDTMALQNPVDDSQPLIKTLPAGEGNKLAEKAKQSGLNSTKNQQLLFFAIAFIALTLPWYLRRIYGDIMAAATLVAGMMFVGVMAVSINFVFKKGKVNEPKILVDNSGMQKAPFVDACLLPGQKVFTNLKPIAIELTKGHKVYNSEGELQKVVSVDIRSYSGKIYHIKPRLLAPFTATPNHPFLVLERPQTKQFKMREFARAITRVKNIKWKVAKDLKEGDLLIYPELNSPTSYVEINFDNKLKPKGRSKKLIPNVICDEMAAEIFGWYLAEGYHRIRNRSGMIGFTLGYHESKIVEHLKLILKQKFNVDAVIDKHNPQEIELILYSKTLAEWFRNQFGDGAKLKRIPEIIFTSPQNVKLAFLKAYIKGDGWETKESICFATVSKELAEDFVFLLSGLGIFPTCHERTTKSSKIGNRLIKGSHLFEFRITGQQMAKLGKKGGKMQQYFTRGIQHFIPIRKIWSEDYTGPIVNMETEDGTYLMPCITHNTGAHAGALLGDCLHDPLQSGGLGTPAHLRVQSGAIHRANNGVLFIDEISTLDGHSQQELLTVLQEKKYPITGQSERSSGAMVRTEPVPADFILVAAGNSETVQKMHPALRSRIRGYGYEVYMNDTIPDTKENKLKIAQFVAQEVVKDGKIPHFSAAAVEEIVREARKRAGRKGRLTLVLRDLGGLVRAAGDIAVEEKSELVELKHLAKARALARTLEQQIADEYIERKKEYEVIKTSGSAVGTVNGLAVIGSQVAFSGIVLPIEAEVTASGIKERKEIKATGKLGQIAKEAIVNVSAIVKKFFNQDMKKYDVYVQFLQTADSGVEGDSASIAVATAIISALKEIPVRQDTAMTGSLSVRGEVLPVGGVTQKVEAAVEAGLKQVIVPEANLRDIVFSNGKKIKIIPVKNIAEVLKHALIWKGKEKILKSLQHR